MTNTENEVFNMIYFFNELLKDIDIVIKKIENNEELTYLDFLTIKKAKLMKLIIELHDSRIIL